MESLAVRQLLSRAAKGEGKPELFYGVATGDNTVQLIGNSTAVSLPALARVVSGEFVAVLRVGGDALILGPVDGPDWVRRDGDTMTGTLDLTRLRLTSTNDASLSSTDHPLQVGPSDGSNLAVDTNEIQARNNGVGSFLGLNLDGGRVQVGGPNDAVTELQIQSNDDVELWLRADADNVTESHNPRIRWSQDGDLVNLYMGIQEDGNHSYIDADGSSLLFPNTNFGAWTDVTFQNSWFNWGSIYTNVQYRKVGDIVYLRGLARKNGTISGGEALFTLPVGFRPPGTEIAATMVFITGGQSHERLNINTDGTVKTSYTSSLTSGNWVTFNSIQFSTTA